MKRTGFTMIELIFVIVILGILAAVAIPKLAATRTDAEVSKGATEIAGVITDVGSYYTAQGSFANDVSTMTNVTLDANLTSGAGATNYAIGGSNCISFTFKADGNVTVASVTNTAVVCVGLQGAVADLMKEHSFGGASVSY